MVPAAVKSVALIVACTVMTGVLYSNLPTSGCGTCPKRSFRMPGTGGYLRLVEWWPHSDPTTWIVFGDEHINVPIPVPAGVIGMVGLLLTAGRLRRGDSHAIKFTVITAAAAAYTGLLALMVSRLVSPLAYATVTTNAKILLLHNALFVGEILFAVALACMLWFELPRLIRTGNGKYL